MALYFGKAVSFDQACSLMMLVNSVDLIRFNSNKPKRLYLLVVLFGFAGLFVPSIEQRYLKYLVILQLIFLITFIVYWPSRPRGGK